ncbi:MarR family transcriptional regulator [Streptomyces sp. NPDC048448]|uniref:MarR family transcriptional regulator n=1 Tax=unclassified Streptomyces TaxID=2593676 RepID=UPI00143E3452|nr:MULTISPECIES: MarR family transcriptional regulator [unclassified Streptomyces]QIY67080.1 MarR family transcriptional regulator [Streptomyces sp. RPA4-2]
MSTPPRSGEKAFTTTTPAVGAERPPAPGTERGAALTELARAAYSPSAADARLRGRATRHQGALSLTHARALRVLAEQGPLSVRRLADRTETTSAGATQLVTALVKAGYVVKEPDPDNRRAVLVTLTPSTG